MLPQQADLQKSWTCTGLHCLPLCASLKWQRNYSRIGNDFSAPPVDKLATSWNLLSLFLTSAQIEQKSFFIPDELSEISLPDNLSESCSATSDQLGPKWYKEIQIGKQGNMVPFCGFSSVSRMELHLPAVPWSHRLNLQQESRHTSAESLILWWCVQD